MRIYGASGHGKVIAEIAALQNVEVDSFIDDRSVDYFYNKKVVKASEIDAADQLIIGIGNNLIRRSVSEKLGFCNFIWLAHPDTSISASSSIGLGTVVMAGARINAEVQIGKHVILNTNCTVDHDCVINDYVHISPGANIAGNVTIGEGSHVGIGASIIQGVKIGKWATIGAGAVIIRDVPDNSLVIGVPGKVKKINDK